MKLVFWGFLAAATVFGQPLRLGSENPHYFALGGTPTVLVTSGEHYGAVLNAGFDYVRYLDTLAKDRLNLTRVFSGSYREVAGDFAITSNTLAPAPGQFLSPWAQREGKFDLTRWDEAYFARLKAFVRAAGQRGIVVELVLFCPLYEDSMWSVSPINARNNLNGLGEVALTEVLALKDAGLTGVQDAMVRKIVSELREFDNLYYEICNEPYFGGVTAEWQEHISRVIAETETGFAKKHLIAQNWANGSSVIVKANPQVGLFNFHYSRPPAAIAMNRELPVALGNNETGFDGGDDATYRIQGWDFLMAGGALYNNLDYSFTVGHEDGSFVPGAGTPGGGSAALRRQLGYLRAFFDEIPFWRMRAMEAGRVSGPDGASVRALEEAGRVYAVYVHHGRVVRDAKPRYQTDQTAAVREIGIDLPAGKYAAVWRDTRTGREAKVERFTVQAGGEKKMLTSPVYAEDIGLIVRAE